MLNEANSLCQFEKRQGMLRVISDPVVGQIGSGKVPVIEALIADDQPLYRDAMRRVLFSHPNCQNVLETSCLADVLKIIRNNDDLNLIMLDLDTPGMRGMGGLGRLTKLAPKLPIIIMSARVNRHIALQAVNHGAMGFIAKSASGDQISDTIRQVLAGQVCICAGSGVLKAGENNPGGGGWSGEAIDPEQLRSLTRRQLLVLERMAQGESNKQIAFNLHIAETTVKAHVSAILHKLRVQNRVQAILATSDLGIDLKAKE